MNVVTISQIIFKYILGFNIRNIKKHPFLICFREKQKDFISINFKFNASIFITYYLS